MARTIASLQARKNELIAEAIEVVNRGLSKPENRAEHERLTAELNTIESDLNMLTRIDRSGVLVKPAAPAPVVAAPSIITETSETRRKKVDAAWRSYLKTGHAEFRDLNTTADDLGAAFIAQDYSTQYAEATKQFGPIASLVSVSRQRNGAPLKVAVSDPTSLTMTYLHEDSSTSGAESDPTIFSTIPGGADTTVATVTYSWQEAMDADDIGSFLSRTAFGVAARSNEYSLLLGLDNGSNTQLPHSPAGGILGNVTAGVSGVAITGPTYANLATLAASVDHSYRVAPGAGFMVNQTTHDFLVAQVDSTGRPLYKFDPNTGLLMVAGKPVYVASSNAMKSYTVNSAPIALFGDYRTFWKFVDSGLTLRVLRERYADQMLNQLVVAQRLSAAQLASTAVKSMTTVA